MDSLSITDLSEMEESGVNILEGLEAQKLRESIGGTWTPRSYFKDSEK